MDPSISEEDPMGHSLSRVRREDLAQDWWIDANRTILYTHDNETLAELRLYQDWVNHIAGYLSILMALVGICANGLVLVRICRNYKLRTPSNYFIANLAISDLIVLVAMLSTTSVAVLLPGYFMKRVLVNAVLFTSHVCVQSTSLVLAAMSFTRYHFIVHPLKARAEWTSQRVWTICGIIWIVSCVIFVPIWFNVLHVGSQNTVLELVPIPTKRKIFTTCRLFPMFIIPGFIILMSYGRIVAVFRSRNQFMRGKSMEADATFQRRSRSQSRKLTKMVIIIILVFFFSWGPYQFYLAGLDHRPYLLQRTPQKWKTAGVVWAILRFIAYSGSAINPFIYAYSNPAFMKVRPLRSIFSSRSKSTSMTVVKSSLKKDEPEQNAPI